MSSIRFDFDFNKLVQAIAYMAWKGTPRLDKLKTLKLLFYADKKHLLRYGRPILGDVYVCMPHGPVPSMSKNVVDDALETCGAPAPSEGLLKYLEVRAGGYPEFVSKAAPDLGVFSGSEVEVLDETLAEYGPIDPWALRQLSHEEPCWKLADERRPHGSSVAMPYELFFEGQDDDAKAILDLVRAEQENRDFAQGLANR